MSEPSTDDRRFGKHLYLLAATFLFIFMGAGAQQAYLVPYLRHVPPWSPVMCSVVIASVYLSMLVFRVLNVYLFASWSDRQFTAVGSFTYLGFTLVMLLIILSKQRLWMPHKSAGIRKVIMGIRRIWQRR